MKRRHFLALLGGGAGALVLPEPRRVYSFASDLRVPSEPWTLGIDRMLGETDREFIDRMVASHVLGRDPIAQAMVATRARRDIDEGELLTDDDVDYVGHISDVPREDKMPGMHGMIEYGFRKRRPPRFVGSPGFFIADVKL